MTVNPAYDQAADALLASARVAAIRPIAGDEEVEHFAESIEWAGRRRVRAALGADAPHDRVLLAGILAAHVVHERLACGAMDDEAAVVASCLNTLWSADLSDRLAAARELAILHDIQTPGLRELGVMLRRAPGPELVAASGQLARAVITEGGAGLAEAWHAMFGTYVLVANRMVRPAATSMVRSGRQKSYVATRAGISRTTLDSWLSAGSSTRRVQR